MSSTLQDYLAIGFTLGLTIIYAPQFYKMIKMKSSEGFHPWYVFLGYMASTISCINAVIYYWDDLASSVDWRPYIESISGFVLLVFQWLLFLIFYLIFVKYYKASTTTNITGASEEINVPRSGAADWRITNSQEEDFFTDEPDLQVNDSNIIEVPQIYTAIRPIQLKKKGFAYIKDRLILLKDKLASVFALRTKKSNIILFILCQILGIILLLITLLIILVERKYATPQQQDDINRGINIWSNILEITTLVMFCLHYLPQIWETVRLKKVGSLSLVTLGMMCPGTFLWTYFLANQSDANLSIWLPYFSVGIMQAVLLAIGIYYEVRDRCCNKPVLTL